MLKVFSVALLSPPYSSLSYVTPSWIPASAWQVGMRVAIPLGKGGSLRVGVLEKEVLPPEGVVLKEILWPLERKHLLPASYMEMVKELAVRHMSSSGEVLSGVLPAALRTTQIRLRLLGDGKPRTLKMRDVYRMSNSERMELGRRWECGQVEILDAAFDAETQEVCSVIQDPPWSVRPSAKRQIDVLEYIWEHGVISRRIVLKELGASASAPLAKLAERGLVRIGERETDDVCRPVVCDEPFVDKGNGFALSEAQQVALDSFIKTLDSDSAGTHLLYGVTGSGKTAVYLELAAEGLRRGLSVFLLAPEVALACKLDKAVRARFGDSRSFFYHGYQTPSERERTFRTLAERTEPSVITGTRSALFLPVASSGVVVLDEEHDTSFKQDEGLVYQAKEIAHFRIHQCGGVLVLGSATPDIKTFYAAQNGYVPMAAMPERVGGGTLPEVCLVDIKGQRVDDGILAPQSVQALKDTVEQGEQAVILLNRRGYAPLMYCLDCGKVARCPHCEVGLTYHKARERLVCHYCGYAVSFPVTCESCKGLNFLPMGEGTEKLEEVLGEILPSGSNILRLDRDSTRRVGRMEAILEAFGKQEAQVLVGTQMLSKGHHFPNVTLVIVADGDLGLNLPDYRAAERTFQLLVQSAGRAGRGAKAGRVFIQTRDPEHYCWEFIKSTDYDGFFAHELALRQKRRYPPFTKFALIRASFPMDWDEGMEWIDSLTAQGRENARALGLLLLGHTPSPMPLVRGRKRFQWAIKSADWLRIRQLYGTLRKILPPKSPLRLRLDLDPVNML